MKRTLEKAQDYDKVIITGVRSPEELEYLKQHTERFKLILVHASREVRFARRSTTDPQSFEAFFERDERDIKFKGTGQVIQKADYVVDNEGAIEAIYKQIEKIIQRIDYVRPSWDEYFIEISKQVAQRGTCDRGKSGCVIVKDKRILTTGYVGSAAGTPHCDDTGHLMKKVVHNENYTSQHCVRTIHAEQNAICQAARAGISLKGATVYCKMEPCSVCAKMIINCGMTKVVCEKMYHAAHETRILFKQTGVKLEILDKTVETYSNQ